jgi:hypothetical protein
MTIGIDYTFSISDIAAIVALIASALTFWFGYVRTRKSEQIRSARQIMSELQANRLSLLGLGGTLEPSMKSFSEARYSTQELRTKAEEWFNKENDTFTKIFTHFELIIDGIEYFIHLVKNHEIEDKTLILEYYPPKIDSVLFVMNNICKGILNNYESMMGIVKEDKEEDKEEDKDYRIRLLKSYMKRAGGLRKSWEGLVKELRINS